MSNLYILVGVVFALVIVVGFLKLKFEGGEDEEKAKYDYKKRAFFMTRAEHECYDALVQAVGSEYLIFAQVHLPTLVDNKVVGQDWRSAFRHISQKSVDFVLCDKAYISPKLAIELDDRTHERPERQERDREVERILKGAGMPLLRLENKGRFDPVDLSQKIKDALSNNAINRTDKENTR
jgi:very-short-patch-repair endonuclease